MIKQLKKINYVIGCFLIPLLLTGATCGEGSKKNKDADDKEKYEALSQLFKEGEKLPPKLQEIIDKVFDPSVSLEKYKEMIKKFKEGEEEQIFEQKSQAILHELQGLNQQQLEALSANFPNEAKKQFLAAMSSQDWQEELKALLKQHKGLASDILSHLQH